MQRNVKFEKGLIILINSLEAIASRLEAIAIRLEAIVIRLEAIVIRLEAIAIAIRVEKNEKRTPGPRLSHLLELAKWRRPWEVFL